MYDPSAINVDQDTNTLTLAINVKPMDTILSALNVNTDTSVAIKQTLIRSMPNLKARSQLVCFNENQITLNTVIKVEFLFQLIYLQISICYILSSYMYLQYYVDIYHRI